MFGSYEHAIADMDSLCTNLCSLFCALLLQTFDRLLTSLVIMMQKMFLRTSVFMRCFLANSRILSLKLLLTVVLVLEPTVIEIIKGSL